MFKNSEKSPSFRSNYKSLLLILVISFFLLQRGGLLLYGYSHIAYPSFDDTVTGVLTHDFLNGQVRAPLFAYHSLGRSGHELMEGILLVPFFELLGHSLFSLKALYLFTIFISLLCWISLIKRYQGMGAALLFAVFFAFPPPMFARLNVMTCSRPFINLMMVVQLLFLFRIIETEENKRAPWLWLGCGIFAGLGSYIFYTYLIFNCFCLLFLLVFRLRSITLRRILLFSGGFCAGFSPWIVRSLYSNTGGSFLSSLLKSISIDLWSFIQNFGFTVPHSFGYHYPSRDLGIISPLFCLFIIFCSGVIAKIFFRHWLSRREDPLRYKLEHLSPALLQGIFFVLFPLFFLICLSLSPMKIMPFEYWPYLGFFGSFSCADVFRYRWLSSLFPFYFGIVAVGTVGAFKIWGEQAMWKAGLFLVLAFFLLCGSVLSVKYYSKEDFKKTLYYKGYSYDEMARRFILSDIDFLDLESAKQFILDYPEENKGEAYRRLGIKVISGLRKDSRSGEKLAELLEEIPPYYVGELIDGVVRTAHMIPEQEFRPFEKVLEDRFPAVFYEKWGFSHLSKKYYGPLLNLKKIFHYMSSAERWIFKNFLDAFTLQVRGYNGNTEEGKFLDEVGKIPLRYQPDVLRGVGMRVGADMLSDPASTADYPLDSRFGEKFNATLKEPFYEGLGGGFAETLCRFFRTLLLPEDPASPLYEKMLDIEWERCRTLMSRVSPSHASLIKKGFLGELEKRKVPDGIRKYLQNKELTTSSSQ